MYGNGHSLYNHHFLATPTTTHDLAHSQPHQTHHNINTRHLLSTHSPIHQSQPVHHQSGEYNDYILGMSPGVFFLLNIFLGFVLTVSIISWICYRRYQTSQIYNENPEHFPNLPELTSKQQKSLSKTKVLPLYGNPKIQKNDKDVRGPNYIITFTDGTTSGVYFDLRQKQECYFEIEVIELNGMVEIGYLQHDSLQAVKEKSQTLGSVGVSLSTSGFVIALGENVYNYGWNLQYGDVIGIALTKQNEKFNERRAWVTRNGILLNNPPSSELSKWLATVEIKDSEREEYNMGTEKHTNQKTNGKELNQEQLEKQAATQKAAKEKEEQLLEKQRIALKTYKTFDFYPTIIFPGVKTENVKNKKEKNAKTIINLNVGGQIFRMQEAHFRGGVLRPPKE